MTEDERPIVYILGSKKAAMIAAIIARESLVIIDDYPLDDTIWVNGEHQKIDHNRPIDFIHIEERIQGHELKSLLEPKKKADERPEPKRHWVQTHPKSMRKR